MQTNERKIGLDYPPLFIAQIGINRGDSLELRHKVKCEIANNAQILQNERTGSRQSSDQS